MVGFAFPTGPRCDLFVENVTIVVPYKYGRP